MLMTVQIPPLRTTRTKSRSPKTIYLTLSITLGSGGKPGRQMGHLALRHPVRIPHSTCLLFRGLNTTPRRLSTTPIRPYSSPVQPRVFSKRESTRTRSYSGQSPPSLSHSTPDYARGSMTVAKPNVYIPPAAFPKCSLLARPSRSYTPFKFQNSRRSATGSPNLLSLPTHRIPSTYSGSIGRRLMLFMNWSSFLYFV
jgi:hypothetical protein